MARRPAWWHQLQASKQEALLAVDLYNRSGHERQLEAFVVHLSIGWLKLLQATGIRDGHDLFTRDRRGHRQRNKDGDWVFKPLTTLADELLPAGDPRRVNLHFFIGLRNKIEHRYERDIAALVAGRSQAWLLNYETTLVDTFGDSEGLAHQLRFPLFVSSITGDAVEALREVRRRVPRGVLEWIHDFDAKLDPTVQADQRFDFRIYLVPHTGPKTEADAAMTFVRLEDLNDEQRSMLHHVQTVIREKQVPVSDLGAFLPKEVAAKVSAAIGRPFSVNDHTKAWQEHEVRPRRTATWIPERTKSDFCRWNPVFKQHIYTQAWVNFLIRQQRLSAAAEDPAT